MQRKTTVSAYVAAFVISVLIFGAGVLTGILLNSQAVTEMEKDLENLKNRAYVLELLGLMSNDTALCKFYVEQVKEFDKETSEFGFKLAYLERSKQNDPLVRKLKSEYSLMEMRDFLLLQKINFVCGKRYVLIIYLYSNKNCSRCFEQGDVLTEIKGSNPEEIMVHSFEKELDSPAVSALVSIYDVKTVPTVVIDGKKLEGFQSKESLMRAIASS